MGGKPKGDFGRTHGGKRVGAGRKPNSTEAIQQKLLGAWSIGAECEHAFRMASQARLDQQLDQVLDEEGLQHAYARIDHARRRFVDQNSRSQALVRAAAENRKKHPAIGALLTIGPLPRPLGLRESICAQVAAKHRISPNTVDKYWKQFRALQSRLQKET